MLQVRELTCFLSKHVWNMCSSTLTTIVGRKFPTMRLQFWQFNAVIGVTLVPLSLSFKVPTKMQSGQFLDLQVLI